MFFFYVKNVDIDCTWVRLYLSSLSAVMDINKGEIIDEDEECRGYSD
jgi:hypothetical protein